jgi:hypothetical protein
MTLPSDVSAGTQHRFRRGVVPRPVRTNRLVCPSAGPPTKNHRRPGPPPVVPPRLPGERPSVSWLVETSKRRSTPPRAQQDPTDLASVGESDLWLVAAPPRTGPPSRETTPGQHIPGDCGRGPGGGRNGRARSWRQPPRWRIRDIGFPTCESPVFLPGQIFKFVPRRPGPAAHPGERPSVSWLVEAPKRRSSPPAHTTSVAHVPCRGTLP